MSFRPDHLPDWLQWIRQRRMTDRLPTAAGIAVIVPIADYLIFHLMPDWVIGAALALLAYPLVMSYVLWSWGRQVEGRLFRRRGRRREDAAGLNAGMADLEQRMETAERRIGENRNAVQQLAEFSSQLRHELRKALSQHGKEMLNAFHEVKTEMEKTEHKVDTLCKDVSTLLNKRPGKGA